MKWKMRTCCFRSLVGRKNFASFVEEDWAYFLIEEERWKRMFESPLDFASKEEERWKIENRLQDNYLRISVHISDDANFFQNVTLRSQSFACSIRILSSTFSKPVIP